MNTLKIRSLDDFKPPKSLQKVGGFFIFPFDAISGSNLRGIETMTSKKSNFIYLFLLAVFFAPSQILAESRECGLEGSVEERIEDCASKFNEATQVTKQKISWSESKQIVWRMVSRIKDPRYAIVHREVWFNEDTGQVWSDRMVLSTKQKGYLTYEGARKACENPEIGAISKANLDLEFRLPNLADYRLAHDQNFSDVLNGMWDGGGNYSGPERGNGVGTTSLHVGFGFWSLDTFEHREGDISIMIYDAFPFPIFGKHFRLVNISKHPRNGKQALCIAQLD